MKAFAILTTALAMAFSASADSAVPFENYSPHFSKKTQIIWDAPTNHLPNSLWTYRRILPRIFTEAVISNAIVLASLQQKGFPMPSTNYYCVPAYDPDPNETGLLPVIFQIIPDDARLSYSTFPKQARGKHIPNDETVASKALICSRRLGLDPAGMVQKNFYTDFNVNYESDNPTTNGICGRGVFFSRQLDGLMFFSAYDDGDGAEGFSFELGSHGKIRAFSVHWSDLARDQCQPVASPREIMQCIRAQKVIVLSDIGDQPYLARLATARKFIISKITPYYTDTFGKFPLDNTPGPLITPIAEIDALADFGNSSMPVQLYSPITSSDVKRVLGK